MWCLGFKVGVSRSRFRSTAEDKEALVVSCMIPELTGFERVFRRQADEPVGPYIKPRAHRF